MSFIIFHLLHLTAGAVGFRAGQFRDLAVYQNVTAAFSVWPVAVFYVVAMGALCLHLDHGIWSMLQTLGWNTARNETTLKIAFTGHRDRGLSWIQRRFRFRFWQAGCTNRLHKRTTEMLEARIPSGPIEQKWDNCRYEMKLVNPANRRKHSIIVVGAGLAGAAAAATLGQQGYQVHCFSYHDTPRRAHSIAAQGGINAAKNYRNDGDSVLRLFKDTVKGGDFRAREANVYRLAEVSVNIIDQCVAQGVPFAREYGGLLDNRSFGGVQVERTFYARGQTGQQLLLGAYQALEEQIAAGTVTMHIRSELLDIVLVNGRARGIVTRDLVTGPIDCHAADVVVLATGGYSNVFYLSTNAKASNCTAIWRAHRRGALFRQSVFHADPSDVHSVEQRASVQADADVRVAAE